MASQFNAPHISIPIAATAAAAVPEFVLVTGAGVLCALDTNRNWAGVTQSSLASGSAAGSLLSLRPGFAGTCKLTASEAIVQGDLLYKAANGRVSKTATGSVQVGVAVAAASGAGSIFEAVLNLA